MSWREALADPQFRSWCVLAASVVGYAFALSAGWHALFDNGGVAYDAHAYWLAGQNVLHGQPLYSPSPIDAFGAYRYPPLFAQLVAPATLLPPVVFSWLWRGICLLSVRWLAGSWRNVGLWLLFPFTVHELLLANVTFPLAVMTILALRGHGWLGAWAGALKFGPLLTIPYVWLAKPGQRRSLALGCVALAAAAAVSFLLDPAAWQLYLQSLVWQSGSELRALWVIALAPTGAADLAARTALAVGLTVVALRLRSDALVFGATILASPVLTVSRLAPLLVLPRLVTRKPASAAPRAELSRPGAAAQ